MNLDNFVVRPQRRLVEKYAQARSLDGRSRPRTLAELVARGRRAASELDRRGRGGEAVRPADAAPAARAAAVRARLRAAARPGQGDRRSAGGEGRHPDGARADGADPGRADRRVVAGRDRADAGDASAGACAISCSSSRRRQRKPIYTDFEDEMGAEVDDRPARASRRGRLREVPRQGAPFLRAHQDHPSHPQAAHEQAAHAADLRELERMLAESGVGDARRHRAREGKETHGLGLFVRSLVGLDREAAKDAFARLPRPARTLTANQIEFVNLIVDHLTEHGVMTAELLYASPFTDIARRARTRYSRRLRSTPSSTCSTRSKSTLPRDHSLIPRRSQTAC